MDHQTMGYDRAITMFSPDGRLLQVEYAKKTVKQGSTAIGLICKDGVLFVTDKRIASKLVVEEGVEKVWQIDDHICATASGIIPDARVLVENAQVKAQQHRVTYNNEIDTVSVVKDICKLKQICTQSGGLRPFGVSLLIAGIDETGTKLYKTDPIGIYFQYRAISIGECEEEVQSILEKKYKDGMTIKEGLNLAIGSLKKALGKEFRAERIEAAAIMVEGKKFKRINKKIVDGIIKNIKG